MGVEEIMAAYPTCPNAVRIWEECQNAALDAALDTARRYGLNPRRVVELMKLGITQNLQLFIKEGLPLTERYLIRVAAIAEMDTPEFLRYVQGKLGAM